MIATSAPNSSGGLFVDEISGSVTGTTVKAADMNMHQQELLNAVTNNGGAGGWVGLTPSGADQTQLWQFIVKTAIEHSFPIGGLFFELDYAAPAGFVPATPHSYRPYLCIDSPSGAPGPAQTITAAHWPLLVPYLIAFRSTIYDGQGGSTPQFSVTTGIVNSNIVCLTFTNNAANNAMLSALSEDAIVNNNQAAGFLTGAPSWTNWQTITLPSSITIGADTINAGTYTIVVDTVNNNSLGVDPANHKVSFSYTASNVGSTACSGNVEFHPFAVAGSTTSAQIMAMQGRTLVSPNDIDPVTSFPIYVPGQRTRDRVQGHFHFLPSLYGPGSGGPSAGGSNVIGVYPTATGSPTTDGTDGTPRLGGTTNARALTAHLYINGGQYLP